MAYPINSPYAQFTDANGDPLENGYIWIGTANLDAAANPITVYWDAAATIPAAQPIRTLNGFPVWNGSPANIYVTPTSYSIKVLNKNGSLVFSRPNVSDEIISSEYVTFLQAGSGAVIETVQTKLRQTVSVWDFMTEAMRADVLAGTKLVDTLPAFVAAMNSFPTNLDSANFIYPTSGTIEVPPGFYYWSDTFTITRNIKLIGVGAPFGNSKGAAQIYVAQNKTALLIPYYLSSPTGKMATGTVIQDLFFQPKVGGGTIGHGVQMDTNARLIRCTFWGFPENGIHIQASTPDKGANQWYIQDCECVVNVGHGLYVDGADVNAGVCIMLNSTQNGGWGIWDSSFLGNTYIGCHTASNGLGPYKSDDLNAANVFLGCYSEGDQANGSEIPYNSMSIGGLQGSVFSANSNALSATESAGFRARAFSAPIIRMGYGVTDNNSYYVSAITATNDVNQYWYLQRRLGNITWRLNAADGYSGLSYFDAAATVANGYARNATGMMGFNGFLGFTLGYNARVRIDHGSAAPSSGEWVQGDRVLNNAPTELGTAGSKYVILSWCCVAGGTPGTWVQNRVLTGN